MPNQQFVNCTKYLVLKKHNKQTNKQKTDKTNKQNKTNRQTNKKQTNRQTKNKTKEDISFVSKNGLAHMNHSQMRLKLSSFHLRGNHFL